MRHLLASAALLLAAWGILAPPLEAQRRNPIYGLTPIARGELRTDRLSAKDLCTWIVCQQGSYIKEYFYPARRGEQVAVYLTGAIEGDLKVTALGTMRSCTGVLAGSAISCPLFDEPLPIDMEVYIQVTSRTAGQEYHLMVEGVDADRTFLAAHRAKLRGSSAIEGINLAAYAGGSRFSTADIDQSLDGGGFALRAGFGMFDRVELFAEYRYDDADRGLGDSSTPTSFLTERGGDAGLRLHLRTRRAATRPYLQGSYGLRRRESSDADGVLAGRAIGAGIGLSHFVSRAFSLDLGLLYGRTSFDEVRLGDVGHPLDDARFSSTNLGVRFGVSLNLDWFD